MKEVDPTFYYTIDKIKETVKANLGMHYVLHTRYAFIRSGSSVKDYIEFQFLDIMGYYPMRGTR